MEKLFELRSYIEKGHYAEASTLIGEMEEMSRDDKISKIESFLEILILHLFKKYVMQRSTRSCEISIRNSIRAIVRSNKRRKAGDYYLRPITKLKRFANNNLRDYPVSFLIHGSIATLDYSRGWGIK